MHNNNLRNCSCSMLHTVCNRSWFSYGIKSKCISSTGTGSCSISGSAHSKLGQGHPSGQPKIRDRKNFNMMNFITDNIFIRMSSNKRPSNSALIMICIPARHAWTLVQFIIKWIQTIKVTISVAYITVRLASVKKISRVGFAFIIIFLVRFNAFSATIFTAIVTWAPLKLWFISMTKYCTIMCFVKINFKKKKC